MITALITGIGGTNSIAVLKALNASSVPHRSIGTDIKAFNAGSWLVDSSQIIPPVSSGSDYLTAIKQIVADNDVKIIFATTETEIAFLAQAKEQLEQEQKVVVMVADKEILKICQDKYKTQVFLRENDFIDIPTALADDKEAVRQLVAQEGYPLVRKPLAGYGSRGVSVIRSEAEMLEYGYEAEYVVQKYIEGDSGQEFDEYTAEVFVNQDGSIAGGIIIQRTLIRGESNSGKVVRDEKTLAYLTKVAQKLGIKGPCNFQYRKSEGKAYIFEINARYSGTSAVRAHFGFNNVDLALKSFVLGDHTTLKAEDITEGYFIRYWEEAYASVEEMQQFVRDGRMSNGK
ncbi:MAG TPA: ATP-grasp domain-containing protein [Candidatus Saccharimonadia bacterium]|nr:ATP-grasp domain-containing protein [Candidatus Saccharimonadia bacterium]